MPGTIDFTTAREQMVLEQLVKRGIHDERVLAAMLKVPRHLFVPDNRQHEAYDDCPIPIGHRQTISQPYIVAFMLQNLELRREMRVLEVGLGSGYQAALLAELVDEVFSIDIVPELVERADKILHESGYTAIQTACRDGWEGWVEQSPFDSIIVAAAAVSIPTELINQLKSGGKLILPVGSSGGYQRLKLIENREGGVVEQGLLSVSFVPLIKVE